MLSNNVFNKGYSWCDDHDRQGNLALILIKLSCCNVNISHKRKREVNRCHYIHLVVSLQSQEPHLFSCHIYTTLCPFPLPNAHKLPDFFSYPGGTLNVTRIF